MNNNKDTLFISKNDRVYILGRQKTIEKLKSFVNLDIEYKKLDCGSDWTPVINHLFLDGIYVDMCARKPIIICIDNDDDLQLELACVNGGPSVLAVELSCIFLYFSNNIYIAKYKQINGITLYKLTYLEEKMHDDVENHFNIFQYVLKTSFGNMPNSCLDIKTIVDY